MRRLVIALTCTAIVATLVACSSGSGGPQAKSAAHDGGQLLNPTLADGRPVFISFDDHHPECFTFPEKGNDTEEVDCPEGTHEVLHDCRGSKLYLKKDGTGCLCVPVSGDAASETDCPDGIETE